MKKMCSIFLDIFPSFFVSSVFTLPMATKPLFQYYWILLLSSFSCWVDISYKSMSPVLPSCDSLPGPSKKRCWLKSLEWVILFYTGDGGIWRTDCRIWMYLRTSCVPLQALVHNFSVPPILVDILVIAVLNLWHMISYQCFSSWRH